MALLIASVLVIVLIGYVWLFRGSVFILAYHGVGFEHSAIPGLVIHPEVFRQQMRLLAILGLKNASIDSIVESILKGDQRFSGRFCITFDDGYRNLLQHALPVLKERSWEATVFVPMDFVGKLNHWEKDSSFTTLPVMNWEELAELTRCGIHVGSHGKAHRSYLTMSEEECLTDMRQALDLLQTRIPSYSRILSYPFGHRLLTHPSPAQKAGYLGACSLVAGSRPRKNQLYDLGRFLVRDDQSWMFLCRLLAYPVVSLMRDFRNRFR
jgi:peptidoglycan/xylan/chitin deacetylase (PgdA/CDA1 family)